MVLVVQGCTDKQAFPTLSAGDGTVNPDTTFAVVQPYWTTAGGIPFDEPTHVLVGYDYSIYVCDRGNDRVVRLSEDGEFIESYSVPEPLAVAQDRGFDLICVNGSETVFRRRFLSGGDFDTVLTFDPACLDSNTMDTLFTCQLLPRSIRGVAASPGTDRNYIIAQFAAHETPFTERIARVSVYASDDFFLEELASVGASLGHVETPFNCSVHPTATGYRWIVSQISGVFKVQAFDAATLEPVVPPPDQGDSVDITGTFVPSGFKDVAGDPDGNLYVVSQATGLVQVFSRNGVQRFSFGGPGSGVGRLNGPRGIAWGDGGGGEPTIYIADTGNNRIARYQSTVATR